MRVTVITALVLALCSGCASFVSVQKSENFVNTKKDIKKVVCIDPEIVFFEGSIFSSIDYEKTLEYQDYFLTRLQKYSNAGASYKYQIYHPLLSDTLPADYFNSLLPLKEEILETLFERDSELNTTRLGLQKNGIEKSVFADAPKISPEFAHLSTKYGTPYFGWYGVLSSYTFSLMIHIVVDVETTEVVTREIMYLGRNLTKNNLPPLMYDSFKLVK